MALTLETTIITGAVEGGFPSGYTAPSTSITFAGNEIEENETWTVAASGVTNATASTGLTALVSAIDTYASGTYTPNVLGLDTTGSNFNMIVTIRKVIREVSAASIFNPGTDQFLVSVNVRFEKV